MAVTQEELERLEIARRTIVPPFKIPSCTNGWEEFFLNTAEFFRSLAPLRIRDGYRLRCFIDVMEGNASSLLFAVPDEPKQCGELQENLQTDASGDPKPVGALEHFMLGVEGDDSPFAYLLASLLTRDGEEFAATWHGADWAARTVLVESPFWTYERAYPLALALLDAYKKSGLSEHLSNCLKRACGIDKMEGDILLTVAGICEAQPSFLRDLMDLYCVELERIRSEQFWNRYDRFPSTEEMAGLKVETPASWQAAEQIPRTPLDQWRWLDSPPKQWEPTVLMKDTSVEVCFFTYTERVEERITLHRDKFQRGVYLPQRSHQLVGTGKSGCMV